MNNESRRRNPEGTASIASLTLPGIDLASILDAIAERLASMLQGTVPQRLDADAPLLMVEQTKELNIPFVPLSQLNRAPDTRGGHRPVLSDLHDSGGIEQDADLVAFIFREELYECDHEHLRGLTELLIAKQRNGPTGLELTFIAEFTKFESRAGDVEDAT